MNINRTNDYTLSYDEVSEMYDEVTQRVLEKVEISKEEMFGDSRTSRLCTLRSVLVLRLNERYANSIYIARYMKKDRATVLHYYEKIKDLHFVKDRLFEHYNKLTK